jgi:cobyrinic acid a,c-diamide synthase
MRGDEIDALFARHASGADAAFVEGNKGLYDGLALDGSNSNAALAKRLGLPVVLVIDARGMTRGVAPLLLGYRAFDRDVRIAGVILNQVGGTRHEGKLRAVIEHYTDVPVLGAVGHDRRLALPERHLGLMPDREIGDAATRVAEIGRVVGAQVDLDSLLAAGRDAAPLPAVPAPPAGRAADLRLGVARDAAFGFYYPDDLEALEAAGAELVFFDTLRDARLPAVDGVVIGGGFPECFMAELEANAPLRRELRAEIDAGLPVYAECGGLMYLARSLQWQGRRAEMVGAIAGEAVMHERPVGRGYVRVAETADHPWAGDVAGGVERLGHEFHHSSLEQLAADMAFAYEVRRGHGVDGRRDGVRVHNVLASYLHQRHTGGNRWPARFVAFVRAHREARVAARRLAAATTAAAAA